MSRIRPARQHRRARTSAPSPKLGFLQMIRHRMDIKRTLFLSLVLLAASLFVGELAAFAGFKFYATERLARHWRVDPSAAVASLTPVSIQRYQEQFLTRCWDGRFTKKRPPFRTRRLMQLGHGWIRSMGPPEESPPMGTPSPLAKRRGTTKPGLTEAGAKFQVLDEFELIQKTADGLAEGKAIGWFQGRMEYGPRALGNRSILGDPRSAEMQKSLNLKVKYRESFRPFAPAVRIEDVGEWFDLNQPSPYMLFVDQVAKRP